MPYVMPERNNQVKNVYSNSIVAGKIRQRHNANMRNLRRIRIQRGLSQTELARMIGTTQPTISKIEKGDMNVTLALIESAAKALGVTPVELFGVSETQQRILEAISAMPEDRRAAAIVVLEAMTKG